MVVLHVKLFCALPYELKKQMFVCVCEQIYICICMYGYILTYSGDRLNYR